MIALGRRYIAECDMLLRTLRVHGDRRPMSLIVLPEDVNYASATGAFDRMLPFDPTTVDPAMWNACVSQSERFCVFPRMHLSKYLVYVETIVLDSDMLCQCSPEPVWERLASDSSVVMLGRADDPSWHWGTIADVSAKVGKPVPAVHGGFFYFRNSDAAKLQEFFATCHGIFYDYLEYGCKPWFRGGKTDEIIFAIAHARLGMSPLEFEAFPVMTFNLTPDMEVPSRILTEGGRSIEMAAPIPFVHMFDKIEGKNYQHLLRKIVGVR